MWRFPNGMNDGRGYGVNEKSSRVRSTGNATGVAHSGINAVERAMMMLEILSDYADGRTISELGDELQVNKGLAHRIMASLVDSGYVFKDEGNQRYRLSTQLLSMAFRHIRVLGMYDIVLPILRRLAHESQELAELNWAQNDRLILVAKAESPRRVRVIDHFGEELVPHATAGGKVWLAHLPEEDSLRILLERGMPKRSDKTITTISDMQAEFERIRERGFAINDQESGDEVAAIAAPVWVSSPEPQVAGTISVVSPASRQIHLDERVIQLTIEAANEVSSIWPFASLDR
jgi:IclR family transcriptional regulator, acetate operon repressor